MHDKDSLKAIMGRISRIIVAGSLLVVGAASAQAQTDRNPTIEVTKTITITDTITQAIASEDLHRETLARLEHATEWQALAQRVEFLEFEFDKLTAGVMSKPELIDSLELDRQLRGLRSETATIVGHISAIALRLEQDSNLLESNAKAWRRHADFLETQLVPPTVHERALSIFKKLDQAIIHVREFRNSSLLTLDRAILLQTRLEDARALVLTRQKRLDSQRLLLEKSPIWQLGTASTQLKLVVARISATWQLQQSFLVQDSARLVVSFFVILILCTWLLTRRAGENAEPIQRAYGRPIAASLLVALVAQGWLAHDPPKLFFELLALLVPIPAAMVASRATKAPIRLTLYGIAVSTMLHSLRALVDASPATDRILMLMQVICIAVPLAIDFRKGRLERAFPWPDPVYVRVASVLALTSSVVIAFFAVFGFDGPFGSVRPGMGIVVSALLVFGTFALVLEGVARALLTTPLAQCFYSVRNRDPALMRVLLFTIRSFAIISIVIITLGTLGLTLQILSTIDWLMVATLEVGTVSVAFKSIALALGVILTTGLLTSAVGFLLSREIVPRLNIGLGTGYAIVTFTRWTMLIVGAMLTLAALGIQMAQVALIAGALSVGIGFGLQNIVNNFVSGLILIIGQPIGVGDVIEWGSQTGTVTQIGIRSSTVRTEQGADILVPNGELISKAVVNWTQSDRYRRYDIDVEVTLGSDAERVIQLLLESAAQVPEVMKKPPPHVELTTFGETTLKFTLHAWMEAVGNTSEAQSALRIAMLNKLENAGVAPFAAKPVEIFPTIGLAPAAQI